MNDILANLNEAQRAAVEYLDGPLLVLAGPGTGKTQLLSARVAHILAETDTSPDSILCLTFTESGASNMRERLGSMVGAKTAARVHINTYHAFGSDVLAQYKNYAETLDRNLDSTIDEVTQYKIIANIQASLSATDILKSAKISDILETIQNAKSARLTPDDLRLIAANNQAESQTIAEKLNPIFANLVPRMKVDKAIDEVYAPALAILESLPAEPIVKNIQPVVNFIAPELRKIIEDQSSAEKPKLTPLSDWFKKYFEKNSDGDYRLKDFVANKKLSSFANILEKYQTALEQDNLFDFTDMIELAIQALKTDEGFRLTLEERYQFILLDEFQDTNPAQFELIRLLTDYENPIIMAVGDDDQAIYAFQGARASNLRDFKNYYNSAVFNLTSNYRSSQEILDLSRKIADQIDDSFANAEGIDKKLRAAKVTERAKIERHEFSASTSEYAWVADQIAELVKNGVKQQDIAIIAPKHKYIIPLLPHLKKHENLYVAYEKRENVLEDENLTKIFQIARYLDLTAHQKTANHLLLEILSYSFWNLDPLTILTAMDRARAAKVSPLEQPELAVPAKALSDLALKSLTAPLEIILDKLITLTEPADNYQKYQFYENLLILKEHLKSHFPNQSLKLSHLIEFLNDYTIASAAILNTSPYKDSDDAVQVLTAHKSKGLEFKYVFLISVDDDSWGNAKGNNNLLVLPKNLAQIRHTGNTENECLRLFFVAITRAKTNLIMTNSVQDFAGKHHNRLEYLAEIEQNDEAISPYLPNGTQTIEFHTETPSDPVSLLQSTWLAPYQKLTPDLKILFKSRLENYRLTATDLTSFIDIAYAGPVEFYKDKILRQPSEPANATLAFGNVMHHTFEAITREHLSNDAAKEFLLQDIKNQPLEPDELNKLEELAVISLEKSLAEFGDILRDPTAKAEFNLSADHIAIDGVPLTGKIDHLKIDEEHKTIEIYDFKTGNHKSSKWESDPTLYKYALQLGFYKILLNHSKAYANYTVTKGHILYVKPDAAEQKVYDKVFEYTDKFEEQEIALIKAVYNQIKTLDFLENPNLFVEPDNSKTIKDIKQNIDILLNL